MKNLIRCWVGTKAREELLCEEKGLNRFAATHTLKIMLIADVVNVMAHCFLAIFGWLPYPLADALRVGLITTTVIAGTVGYLFTYFLAEAIRDVSLNRNLFEHLSTIDPLSKLLNRRAFFVSISREGRLGTLVLFDIDHFKQINDTYGHLIGDAVIERVSAILQWELSSLNGSLARVGGEEFALYVPTVTGAAARTVADAARIRIAAEQFAADGRAFSVTISAGIAAATPTGSLESLFKSADDLLYLAKAGGRNRIVTEDDFGNLPFSLQRAHTPRTQNG